MTRKPNDAKGEQPPLTYEVVREGGTVPKRRPGRPANPIYARGYRDGYNAAKTKYLGIVKILMEG